MSKTNGKWRRRIGRVSVYRRGQQYWIYYRQGRHIRRPVGTCRSEALALAAKINVQLAEGAPTALAFRPADLGELIGRWLDHHEQVRRAQPSSNVPLTGRAGFQLFETRFESLSHAGERTFENALITRKTPQRLTAPVMRSGSQTGSVSRPVH